MAGFDKGQSKIKMTANTQVGCKNIVWYSFIKYNHQSSETIIKEMIKRFKKTADYKVTNVLQFRENGEIIEIINIR